MMHGLVCTSWMLLPLVGLAWAQDLPKPESISDVTLSVVGDASGLPRILPRSEAGSNRLGSMDGPLKIPRRADLS